MSDRSQNSPSSRTNYRASRIIRVRQGLAVALLLVALAVVFYWWRDHGSGERRRTRVAPVGLTIRQTAHGFSLSQSEGGRPVFSLHADQAVQLKQGSQATLKNVRIDLYNQDGTRADQIYGQEFSYDPATGMVAAHGMVHIDLGGIPGQETTPSAETTAPGEEAGHPIHIQTNDLLFNTRKGTGDVRNGLVFRYLGAEGKADSAHVATHPDVLTLAGHVQLHWTRADGPPVQVSSNSARLDKIAALVQLDGGVSVQTGPQHLQADRLQLKLRPDYSVREAIATGHVIGGQNDPERQLQARANQADAVFVASAGTAAAHLAGNPGKGMQLSTLRLNGDAELQETAPQQQNRLAAGALTLLFGNGGALEKLEARQNASLVLTSTRSLHAGATQAREALPTGLNLNGGAGTRLIQAPGLDFLFASGKSGKDIRIEKLQSVGRAHIETHDTGAWMIADANQFDLAFDAGQHPQQAEAVGEVSLKQQPAPVKGHPQPLRTSHSDRLQLVFIPAQDRLQQAIQQGHVRLQEADRQVRSDVLHYDAATEVIQLQAQPVSAFTHGEVFGEDATLRFRAPQVRLMQTEGRVQGWGGVQVSFLSGAAGAPSTTGAGPQSGPMFNSRLPVDITADQMDVLEKVGQGQFKGRVRMWQGQNLTLADSMHFDRSQGQIEAIGHVVSTFVQPSSRNGGASTNLFAGLPGKNRSKPPAVQTVGQASSPIAITAQRLDYSDASHQGTYRGDVVLTSTQARLTARELQVYLQPGAAKAGAGAAPAALDKVIALGAVRITQPGREAKAETVQYNVTENLITMTGGPPSIYDAEHGYLTGQTLTFSPSNDTIRVESQPGTRTFGEYRVKH